MKKKGFTLIELLAVIVVLAIIALIATPIVMNVIKKANMGASERSADNYVKAVETLIATEKLDGTPMSDGEYTIDTNGKLTKDGKEYEVEVSGTKPVGGTVNIQNGQVVKDDTTIIEYEDYTVKYPNGKAEASEKGESSSELAALCDFLEDDAHNEGRNLNTVGAKYTCDLGDGERTFYILEIGSNPITNSTLESNEVALILEGNYDTTTQAWCESGSDNACEADGLEAKLDDIVETAWTKLEKSQIGIPSIQQIMVADEREDDAYLQQQGLKNRWLYSYPGLDGYSEGTTQVFAYWTSTPYADDSFSAWVVQYNGSVAYFNVMMPSNFGIRPVITLSI